MTMIMFLRFSLYALVALFDKQPTEAMSYLETNEVSNKVDERIFQLPSCSPDSICGYLQANVRGISYQRLCACPNGIQCPMTWDSEDGHSVTQGSDQYKYCGRRPTLKVCNHNEIAYSSRMVYSKATEELYSKTERVHCICPADHNYVLAHQHFDEPDADSEAMGFSYTCVPLPLCEMGDSCKTVTEKGPEFLVNQKCRCPGDLRCPTLGNHGVKSFEMGNGRVDMLRCQH